MNQKRRFYHVSKKLLPVKLHFLILFAGFGGVRPFQSLVGKGLNISATAVGITNTTLMGLTLLCKPLVGSMVDYFRNIRAFLIFLVLVNALSTMILLLLPPIGERSEEDIYIRLQFKNSQDIFVPIPVSFDGKCLKGIDSEINCNILQIGNTAKGWVNGDFMNEIQLDGIQDMDIRILNNRTNVNASFALDLHPDENFPKPNQSRILHLECEPDVRLCTVLANPPVNEYKTYQFWAFACIIIISGLAMGNLNSLSDVACYEILGEQRHQYGRQRLFGTIGWSLSCLLSGYLSDLATGDGPRKDYSPGFYLMLCLMVTNAVILYIMPLNTEPKMSTSIYKDVRNVFHSNAIVLFAVGSVLIGSLMAAIAYYELWYLQDLGASQSLLGWTIIIQGLVAEMPFFVISGWFLKKFGSFNCLMISFAVYALRFGCYSVITNPRWALLIAMTHGLTFAIFEAAMTNFVSLNAPEGVEGTMFGIFGGLVDGMGQASGSLLCGAAFDKLGGRLTYTIAGIFSGACALAFLILSRLLTETSNRPKEYAFESISLEQEKQ